MKRTLRWSMGPLIAAVTLTLVLPTLGATRHHNTKPLPPNEHKPGAHWELESTDASANTITLQKSDGSTNLTLKVSGATRFIVEDKPGKLADLQKGQKITFSASGDMCTLLDASAPDPKDAKKDTKKKKK